MCRLFLFCLCIVFLAILVQGTADKEKKAEPADEEKETADKDKNPDFIKKPADKVKKSEEKGEEPEDKPKKPGDKDEEEQADKSKKPAEAADRDKRPADKDKRPGDKDKKRGEKDEDSEDKEKEEIGKENRCEKEMERRGCFKKCPVFKAVEECDGKQFEGIWIEEFHANENYLCCEFDHKTEVSPNGERYVDFYAYNFTEQMHLNFTWKFVKVNGGYYSNTTQGSLFQGISPFLYCNNGCMAEASCSPDPRTGTNVVTIQIVKQCGAVCDMDDVTKALKQNKIDKVPLVRNWDNEKCPRHFADKKKCKYSQA